MKGKGDNAWWYVDTNVHEFKAKKDMFPMCDVYDGEKQSNDPDMMTRWKMGTNPEGYLVDWNMRLGNDKEAAQWLFQKLEVRPVVFGVYTSDAENGKWAQMTADGKMDTGGAFFWAPIVREDEPGLKQLVSYVICEEQKQAADTVDVEATIRTLKQHLREHLPSYMVPSHIVLLQVRDLIGQNSTWD